MIQSLKNTIGDRLLNKASSFPLTTQATVDSHPSVPKSDSNSKGPRFSGPFRPISGKNVAELSILHENSGDEDANESLLPSPSEIDQNTENKENHSCDLNLLSTSPSQGEIRKQNHETIEMEEDIKSYASSKSEVFYDAQSSLGSVDTITNEVIDSHPPLERTRGRNESNFDVSFYNKVINTKKEAQITVEQDMNSKKKSTRRTVSFSNASKRWTQLRSANRISSNFSRISKRQSSISNPRDEVDHEGVELRRNR